MSNLIIVESPAKAKSIQSYLGKDYIVLASYGHLIDLPKKELGIDIKDNFKAKYVTMHGKGKQVSKIKKYAKNAEHVYLATDPDREGEAIAWHIANQIKKSSYSRVTFNEITKKAVRNGVATPKKIDMDMVNAQQARRLLDRLVGYQVSPLLWGNIEGKGLSAGRVQSVALRMVCELEDKIQNFKPEEYWSITAKLYKDNKSHFFEAKLVKINNKKINKFDLDKKKTKQIIKNIKNQIFFIKNISYKTTKRNPLPPFITNTLQEEASSKLDIRPSDTMKIAQTLYEGVDIKGERKGLITYMRTDSTRIADEAVRECRRYIGNVLGEDFLPKNPNIYTNKDKSQDAHEAIRPTDINIKPEDLKSILNKEELKIYELIWRRFVASQMKKAEFNNVKIDINVNNHTFRANGSQLVFPGFLEIYKYINQKDNLLPSLDIDDELNVVELKEKQHFTKPPSRYTEASLISDLKEKGIGRPSTYASIISNITNKKYVKKYKRKYLKPTELGEQIIKYLLNNFSKIFEVNFTSNMESDLDKISKGSLNYIKMLKQFYSNFEDELLAARKKLPKKIYGEKSDKKCDKCGADMYIKKGKHGKFLACSDYPKCKNTISLEEKKAKFKKSNKKCDKCGADLLIKKGKYGEFLACSAYPKCKNTTPLNKKGYKKTEKKCPDCNSILVERSGKNGKFLGCSAYPKCEYTKSI
ncbi:MAG: type I DNA topoisomerase [archaeon]